MHALVRSVRIQAALANEVLLDELRALAALHVVRAYATDLVDALAAASRVGWSNLIATVGEALLALAREQKTSRSRRRISVKLGTIGA